MDVFVLFAIAVSCVIVVEIPYLGYYLASRYGHRKIGIALGSMLAVLMLHLIYPEPLSKLFFTRNDARELLARRDLKMQHEFQLVGNEYNQWSSPAQSFVLTIHSMDKTALIEQIRSSSEFINNGDPIKDIRLTRRYFGNPVKISYETPTALICKFLTPANKDGYAPVWQMITVSKTSNELVFEEWYD